METKLKVLMVGSDRKLFEEGSAVSERIKEYGALVGELHIIVFSKNKYGSPLKIAENVWVYSTGSFSRWFYVSDASRLGKKLVAERGFVRGLSLITAQDPFECGLAALKIKNKWRLPLEIQLHTDPFSPYFSGLLNFLRKIIARRILHKADSIRVVSEYLKLKAISYKLKAPISVLPIYIDKGKFSEVIPSLDLRAQLGWNFILLCVARLTPEKNLSLALRTLALVRKKLPGAGLVLVGSGPEEGKLKSLAKRLGILDHVYFAGWQKNTSSYFRASSVFLQASVFEGYGMALVEAGLSGLPVVSTPVGLAQELKDGQEAFLCPPEAPEAFAEAVFKIARDNQLRELLKSNMRGFLEGKLPNKDEYLSKMKENWERTAGKVDSKQ